MPVPLRRRSPLRLRSWSPMRLRSRSPLRLRSKSPVRGLVPTPTLSLADALALATTKPLDHAKAIKPKVSETDPEWMKRAANQFHMIVHRELLEGLHRR